MKIICSQSDLKNNLSLVSRIVPSRPEPTVLGNVLIEAQTATQKVSITAYDGNMGIQTSFNAEVVEAGSITLPAKLINEIVTRLPEMEITLDTTEDEENLLATLSSTSGKFELSGIDAAEFPELPVIENAEKILLPVAALSRGLAGCLFAASTELSKQVLTGVHVKSQESEPNLGTLEFAATDSHRLSVVEADLKTETEEDIDLDLELPEFAVTIPAKALRELERMFGDAEATDMVKINFDDTQMSFKLGDRLLNSSRITGDYPAYWQLIPKNFSREAIVERKRLISSLELVAVLAQKNNIVKFSLDSDRGELVVSADARDIGSAKQTMSAEIIGDNIDIAFNIKYLMDGLKALSATEIKMQLNEWNQPVIFTPLSGSRMTYLVMPVQIRN
ncbi:DNA polymerase III subunit beta [Myxosarcina sp. GI1]|uniref:DNA polymerase III subunit beta n=1 Tax=Myxosarcina sp. GI1 TaxID=1541065 RepID=UPI00055CD719|nr:DNA polymerase III subunit beta [Myxosarcina sp. GI1]